MESKGLKLHSQGLSNNFYPELNQSSSLFWHQFLMFSHLCLGLPRVLFHIGLPVNIWNAPIPYSFWLHTTYLGFTFMLLILAQEVSYFTIILTLFPLKINKIKGKPGKLK